jgi:hypothetical protein
MSNLTKYQLVAFFVAGVFGLFNIGIPIVIASCPMAKYGSAPVCAACSDGLNAHAERLTGFEDSSCCTTVIAADRNTNEFVQWKVALSHFERMDIVGVLPSMAETSFGPVSLVSYTDPTASPPHREDIPIFISSLLI